MSNLKLWKAVDDIDPQFTKPITGKQYKGTSPNPQYLIKLATEHLGPVGKGFGWKVIKEEFTPLGTDVLHWCRIEFWWSDEGVMHSFEQYGQTKAHYVTSSGKAMTDEDAPKKSLTDAVVKSLSQLGFAANIFLGRWDDQKYVAEVESEYRAAEKTESAKETYDDLFVQLQETDDMALDGFGASHAAKVNSLRGTEYFDKIRTDVAERKAKREPQENAA